MAFIRQHFKQNSSEAPTPKKKKRKSLTFSRGGRAGGFLGSGSGGLGPRPG